MINMKNKILYEISIKLQELRNTSNLTQNELSKKININRNTYTNWETGRTEIPMDMLNAIACFYNINIDYLLGLNKRKKVKYKKELDYNKFASNLKTYMKNHSYQ